MRFTKTFFRPLTVAFALCAATLCRAQLPLPPNPSFASAPPYRLLTVNEGLPQGLVRDTVQDRRGFIWLASEGLCRYDGRSFFRYRQVFGDSSSLLSDNIHHLELDDKDNLWIGYFYPDSVQEIDVLNTVTERIRHISKEPAFRWLKDLGTKGAFFVRQSGGRFFVVSNYLLVAFDPATGRHEEIPVPAGEKLLAIGGNDLSRCPLSTTKALYDLQGNRLRLLFRYPAAPDTVTKQWRFHPSWAFVGKILPDENGGWVITTWGGVFIYNPQKGTCRHAGNSLPTSLPIPVKAADRKIYFGMGSTIFRLTNRDEAEPFCESPFPFVTPFLLADRSGVLWASMDVHGLCLYDLHPPNFRSAPNKRGFADEVLDGWLHRPAGKVSYGSYKIRSARDGAGGRWVLNRQLSFLPNGREKEKVLLFRLGAKASPVVFEENSFLPVNIAFDKQGVGWLAINNLRADSVWLAKADLQQGKHSFFAALKTTWTDNSYLTAAGSRLCYLNDNGLWLFDRQTAARKSYSKEELGVGGSLLMAVPDAKDEAVLWIATKGSGILRFNTTTGEKSFYNETTGLPNNTVYFMAPDRKGFFWCSSNKGLFRFEPQSGKVTSFTVKDGLQGNEFNRYHFLETPDGHFFFGGTNGTTVFHPDSIFIDDYNPPVVLTGIAVNNLPLQQTDPKWRDAAIPSLTHLSLAHNQNFLGFNFAGLQYSAPEKLQYRYRLRGLHDDWVMTGYDASAKYAALPPGHYVFEVNASNTAGVWSSQISSLSLTVLPPWWLTWWAYAGYALAAAGIGYAAYRNWLMRAKAKQKVILKEKEAAQAMAMEELKSRFFANVTHELRTPLTLILSPVQKQLADGNDTVPPGFLRGIYQNSKTLLQLINQLLDMGKLEAGKLPVTLSRGNPGLFIDGLQKAFRPQADLKNIRFTYTHPQSEEDLLFDSDKLEKIVFNLLGNAFKFTPDGGRIGIELKLRDEEARRYNALISVTDSGIGIAPEHLPYVFNRFYQVNASATRRYEGTGIGLSLVKELVELMGGSVGVESTEGKGSTFTVSLPLAVAGESSTAPEVGYAATAELAAAAAPVPSTDTGDTSKPLVLVADDNEGLRRFIADSLSPHYRVLSAANGQEALETATAELPELIISDVMMPVMDGYELCEKIKAAPLTGHIGFVMLTAKTADESRMSGLRLGADHYLGKPFNVEELLLVVSNLLKRQQKLREHYSKQLQPAGALPPVSQVEDPFLQQVYTVIEENLDSDGLDVEFLASALTLSRRTLNRKLSAIANTSANELIRHYRLKKAAGFLLAGHNVSEAAYATGFSTPSWFIQCFKELYGLTPTQWAAGKGLSQN